jgi:membrane associated rhomboid family serine protease
MHLLFNMYGLLFVGLFLEPVLGSWRFALYYLASGLIASIASLKIHPDIVGVGASGAIFGMYGVFLACLLTGVFPPGMKKAFLLSTLIFVGANLVMGLSGNTDNAAHIGGLVSGFLIGFFFSRKLPNLL